jgi:hypothetical protein
MPGSRQALIVSTAFVFTVIALLPYLKVSFFHGGLPALARAKDTDEAQPTKDQLASASDGYSGIILLSPSEERERIIAPVKHEVVPNFSHKFMEPVEIPFDGAYWYFKAPDKAPRPTARVVRGSSTKTTIRSSDRYPLLMEAHQKLTNPIDLGCCSAIQMVVQNADRREGAIALELWVRKDSTPRPVVHYLGTMAIPSSERRIATSSYAASPPLPSEEKLIFPIPSAMDGIEFDEITVVVRLAPARARTGAQIAIRKFVLEP